MALQSLPGIFFVLPFGSCFIFGLFRQGSDTALRNMDMAVAGRFLVN